MLGAQSAGAHASTSPTIEGAPQLERRRVRGRADAADPAGARRKRSRRSVTGRVTGVDLTGESPVLLLGARRLVLTDVDEVKQHAASDG